ncbi:uncharacterized protein LOC135492708 [Lineus longissimus]|uniref:uncharacterized protein LOC135492708 n=1 Tax=Lineus longissimus TaxID=88925 RepID=UPI002B4D5B9E
MANRFLITVLALAMLHIALARPTDQDRRQVSCRVVEGELLCDIYSTGLSENNNAIERLKCHIDRDGELNCDDDTMEALNKLGSLDGADVIPRPSRRGTRCWIEGGTNTYKCMGK